MQKTTETIRDRILIGLTLSLLVLGAAGVAGANSEGAIVAVDPGDAATADSPNQELCCKALTARCLACAAGVSEATYCEDHPETMGCGGHQPNRDALAEKTAGDHRICCKALTAHCLACAAGVDEETYCSQHPEALGCDSVKTRVAVPLPSPYSGPEFVATDEWQVVAEGQPIPPGLHVSVDMQTGEKRARLMPDGERPGILTMSERRAKKLKEIEEAIGTLSDADDGDASAEGDRMQAYIKSLKEIKSKGLQLREDSELLLKLVGCLGSVDSEDGDPDCWKLVPQEQGSSGARDQLVLALLASLEDLVHHVDNAVDVGTMGGYEQVVRWVSDPNATSEVRGAVAVLLGAASSNNPKAREAVIAAGALPRLTAQLQTAVGGGRLTEAKRTVHAIGALIRHSPTNVAALHAVGGFAALHDTLTTATAGSALSIKVIRLVTDITQAVEDPPSDSSDTAGAGSAETLQLLAEAQFCGFVVPLLTHCLPAAKAGTIDVVEAAVGYARALAFACTAADGLANTAAAAQNVADGLDAYVQSAPSGEVDHVAELALGTAQLVTDIKKHLSMRTEGDL